MWGLSLMACFFLGSYVFRKSGKDEEKVTIVIQYVFIFGLIGSRLAHVVFYQLDYYLANPWTQVTLLSHHIPVPTVMAVWEGGLASHGGVAGGLFGLYLFCRRNKEFGFLWTLDHGIIAVVILASLVRFGNLMNSELCGKLTNVPWAFIFPQGDVHPNQACHPVVLYESIAYFFIQLLMLYLFDKYRDSKPGIYLVVFFLLIFSVRFMLEFFKEPDGNMVLGIISKTQALNLPFIFAGFVLLYFVSKNKLSYK